MVVPVTAGSVPNTRPPSPRALTNGQHGHGQGQGQSQLMQAGGMQDPTLGGGGGVDLAGFAGLGGGDQFQLGSADMLFNTLGPSEQELLSSLNGDDAAWMTDVTTTTSDFPYWSSLSFAPGDVSAPSRNAKKWSGVEGG